jgi:hypothetical protein
VRDGSAGSTLKLDPPDPLGDIRVYRQAVHASHDMIDRLVERALKLLPGQESPENVGRDGGERSVVSAGRQCEAVTQLCSEPEFGQLSPRPDLAEAVPMGDISDRVSLTSKTTTEMAVVMDSPWGSRVGLTCISDSFPDREGTTGRL